MLKFTIFLTVHVMQHFRPERYLLSLRNIAAPEVAFRQFAGSLKKLVGVAEISPGDMTWTVSARVAGFRLLLDKWRHRHLPGDFYGYYRWVNVW